MSVSAIILAAGAGTRMRSDRPKPLHRICGRPMVLHVIHALEQLRPAQTAVVVGHAAELVTKRVHESAPAWANVVFAEQVEQNGTGDAAAIGMASLGGDDYDDDATVVILPGDAPLLEAHTLDDLVATHVANSNAATLLTSVLDDPTGYGRIVRASDRRVLRVVEQRDATPDELDIKEWNTGVYAFRRDLLGPALRNLNDNNSQREFYLTDVIAGLAGMGHRVGAVQAPATETQGVNDRWQLALAERALRNRTNRRWLLNGVTMLDPRQTFIDVTVQLGRDITIYPGTILQGDTRVGDDTDLGPDTQLDNCLVGSGCSVTHTVARDASIGDGATVGPYAHLAAGANVAAGAVTGSFYTAPVPD
jgi:bifunctional UDP-N-acetylglucosamine pyrophosphorylase / glucosamine-1-phosphate N-acetyltransferase